MTDANETSAPDDPRPEDDGREVALCPKCMAELPPMTDFCPRCRAPVSSYANSGYYEGALAEGWSMGESVVAARPRLVTLIGLWLLFLPGLIAWPVFFFASHRGDAAWVTILMGVVGAGLCALFAWCLYRGTRNYIRARRSPSVDEPESSEGEPQAAGAPPAEDPAPPPT